MLGGHNETRTGLLLPNIINESDCKVQQFGLMIKRFNDLFSTTLT